MPTGSPQPPDDSRASTSPAPEAGTFGEADWLTWFTDNQSAVAGGIQQAGGVSGHQLGWVEAFTYADERTAGASRADLLVYIAPAGGEGAAGSDGLLLHVQGTGLDQVNPQDLNAGVGEFFDRLGRGVAGAVTGAVSGAGTGMVIGGVVGSVAPGPAWNFIQRVNNGQTQATDAALDRAWREYHTYQRQAENYQQQLRRLEGR